MESTKLTQLVYPELITTEKLKVDGSNFFTWKSKIKLVFCELGITYVLKDPKPAEPTDDSSKEKLESLDKWVSDDRRCRFAMLFAMENDLFQLCNRHTTAKSIMDYLTLMYVSTSLTTRMILFSKYTEHKMSEETPINDHLMEMGLMAYQLKKAGLPISQDMQVVLLMNSLPDSWDTVRRVILYTKPEEQTLFQVSMKLRLQGELRALEKGKEPATKKQRNNEGGFKGRCYSCGKRGHAQADCPDN